MTRARYQAAGEEKVLDLEKSFLSSLDKPKRQNEQ